MNSNHYRTLIKGIDQSRWTPTPHRLRIDGKERKSDPGFEGDEEAMRAALETPYKRGRVTKGVIGSAFEFNKYLKVTW